MAPRVISIIGALHADRIMVADRMPKGGESRKANHYNESLGGRGANSAIATYRTCHRKSTSKPPVGKDHDDDIHVRVVGAVGDDEYSELFHNALKRNGVDTSGLVTIRGKRSGLCLVQVDRDTGENRCIFILGATEAWKKEDFMKVEDLAHGPRPDLVIAQMEIRKEVVQQMIETAGKAGIDFLLKAAPADWITRDSFRYITHLLMNESESGIMSGCYSDEVNQDTWPKIAQEFLDLGVKNVVITLGVNGAYYATATGCGNVSAYKVKVVDSTGAGDTFTGAYASEYLRQKTAGTWDIKSTIIRANKAAAFTVGKLGAQEGIPWADEIDQFEG